MKTYTRTGDKGETNLIGCRVPKTDMRIECIGAIDETMSAISIARMSIEDPAITQMLLKIERKLAKITAIISGDNKKIEIEEIKKLEDQIDQFPVRLQEFTRPKTEQSAFLDLARTICRRAERTVHKMELEENIRSYMNRTSDFLYSLSFYFDNLE